MKRDIIDIEDYCEGSILLDGFETAIVGIVNTFQGNRILYNRQMIIDILCKRDSMTLGEAEEFFDYNILGGSFGELNPLFLDYVVKPIKTTKGFHYEIIS